jgi:hypothetical protein
MQLPWIEGPQWLCQSTDTSDDKSFPLIEPDSDVEIRPLSTNVDTEYTTLGLGIERFERFSKWKTLINVVMLLQKCVREKFRKKTCTNSTFEEISVADAIQRAEFLVI